MRAYRQPRKMYFKYIEWQGNLRDVMLNEKQSIETAHRGCKNVYVHPTIPQNPLKTKRK